MNQFPGTQQLADGGLSNEVVTALCHPVSRDGVELDPSIPAPSCPVPRDEVELGPADLGVDDQTNPSQPCPPVVYPTVLAVLPDQSYSQTYLQSGVQAEFGGWQEMDLFHQSTGELYE